MFNYTNSDLQRYLPNNSNIKLAFYTVLFVFIGLFLYVKFFGPIPFSVNSITTTKQSFFTVDGVGKIDSLPSTAQVSLGVNKSESNVDQAKNEVNTIINKITQDVKNLGIDPKNITTTNFSVNPNYDYTSGNQTITGYSVNTTISVKTPTVDIANKAIDGATKDGATQVGGVQFMIDDQTKRTLEDQARKQAIENAKHKASVIANASGIRLGKLVDVKETNQFQPGPIMYAQGNSMAKDSAPTQLNAGQNQIQITVTLSYETY